MFFVLNVLHISFLSGSMLLAWSSLVYCLPFVLAVVGVVTDFVVVAVVAVVITFVVIVIAALSC